jgi:hypothetical protein
MPGEELAQAFIGFSGITAIASLLSKALPVLMDSLT